MQKATVSIQQPMGWRPGEIAMLVNEGVVEQHAEEAAFLWRLRRRAASEPHVGLMDLAALDRRVEANLSGLRVAGEHGWRSCRMGLERHGPGEVFALSVLAFASGDRKRMRDALYAACASRHLQAGLVSALAWLEHDAVAPWLHALLESAAPEHRAIAVTASALHHHDPGAALAAAIDAEDAALRACALRAAGQLKLHRLTGPVQARLTDAAPAARFWAAWSLTLLGHADGPTHLMAFADAPGPFAFQALQLGLRALPVAHARARIRALAARADTQRLTVLATGIFGDAASVPWLIQAMADPQLCRLAGEAFTSITGVDLAHFDLVQTHSPPLGDDSEAPPDPVLPPGHEANLQWPAAALVAAWWNENAARFAAGQRYTGGQPLSRAAAFEVLRKGRQRQRAGAALELACIDPQQALINVREVGDRQLRRLARWTS